MNSCVAKWILLMCAVLTAVLLVDCRLIGPIRAYKRRESRVCGDPLRDLIKTICKDHITSTTPSPVKRSKFIEDYYSDESPNALDFIIGGGAMVPSWNKRNWNYNSGMAKECCKKSCTVTEMQGYCNGRGGFNSWHDIYEK